MAKSKKSNGEGSISFETARNKWRASIVDPYGKRIVKRFATHKEAQEWIVSVKATVYNKTYVAPSNITVGEWMLEYLETYCAPNVRKKTLLRYMQVAGYMLPIASIPLQQLAIPDVQRFYNTITLSASTKIKIHTLLKAAVTKACQVELLSKNVMLNINRPKADQAEVQIFTQAEIHIILRSIKESSYYAKYYPLFAFAIATGARLGEILGLKLNCVHPDYVEIKNSLQLVDNKLIDMPPKTKAGNRKVTISPAIANLLKRASKSGKVISFDGYVFHNKKGGPLFPRNVERIWKSILQEATVPYRNFHCLRHTHATQLLATGLPILEIAKRLGHSSAVHTLKLYGHAIPGFDSKIPTQVEKIFFETASEKL